MHPCHSIYDTSTEIIPVIIQVVQVSTQEAHFALKYLREEVLRVLQYPSFCETIIYESSKTPIDV